MFKIFQIGINGNREFIPDNKKGKLTVRSGDHSIIQPAAARISAITNGNLQTIRTADDSYWDRRRRNNEAAKRSREKRRISDMVLESRVLELTRENTILKSELYAIKDKFGLSQSTQFQVESDGSIISGLSDNRGRRDKIIKTIITTGRLAGLKANVLLR